MSSLDVTDWVPAGEEYLGTKPKQWLAGPDGSLWLWKESTVHHDLRHGSFRRGDDWSEVVAAGVGRAVGVPVAEVSLATRADRFGVVSRRVLDAPEDSLVHGNELLAEGGIAGSGARDRAGYTVAAVMEVLAEVGPPVPGPFDGSFPWFSGYLILDALVGNTDRHQDNWAVIRGRSGSRLAPSFDHASCLGFQISDAERLERLEGRGNRTVAGYAAAGRTKFEGSPRLVEAAIEALALAGEPAVGHWSRVVRSCPDLAAVVSRPPAERMSAAAWDFASALYARNHTALSEALRTMAL